MWRRRQRTHRRVPESVRLIGIAILALVLFGFGGVIMWASLVPIPSIDNFENREVAESTKIYDRTGNVVLYDVHGAVRRTSVPLDRISPYIQHATIAIEDESFYSNVGFRPLSLLRALIADIMHGGYVQGGSTITQQVVKNALLTGEKTISRKLEEIVLAIRLTKAYSKQEILSAYLNENPYGGTIYGVQEASQYFFGIDAKDVDLAQAAYLAAIPQAPTYYSPYGNHKAQLDARQKLVLAKMLEHKFISEAEYRQAKSELVAFKGETEAGIKAPHFVFYIREYLEQKYGVDAVDSGGLRVITSLDYDLQQKAEDSVAKFADKMQSEFNASNEGIVAVEPTTGQILAMVGSRDFNNKEYGQVNVTTALRQPGSSFKPFVYATAFQKGYTPSTVVFDLQTQFSTACSPQDVAKDEPPCYSPQNYDGKFRGPMTLRDALAQSENIPAVKTLYLAGIDDSIAIARSMGISTLEGADRYGLTLVLGGGEVTLLDMTGAYAVFANDGVRNAPTGILKVTDKAGKVLEEYKSDPTRVLDPQIARLISDVLSDNKARTPEFGADSPLYFPGIDVADKTGTTNDSRDTWIVGYTPGIAVGAWAGNNDNTPMVKKIAAFIVAPMWHDFMEQAIQKYPSGDFTKPAPETDQLPPVLTGNWNTDVSQGVHDILYWVPKNNPRSSGNSRGDGQFAYWEYPVQLWAVGQGAANYGGFGSGSPVQPTKPREGFRITAPQAGTIVSSFTPFTMSASNAQERMTSVTYYVNGQMIGTAAAPSFSVTVLPNTRGPVQLRAVAQLANGGTAEQTIVFTIQ